MGDSEALVIEPTSGFDVAIADLPGSKSLSNRALIVAALANGESTLEGLLFADDTRVVLDALSRLGFPVSADEARATARVTGRGGAIPEPSGELSLGNAGTAMRFLTAACCLGTGPYTLDGVARMRQRPIDGLVEPLRELGASIAYGGEPGYPPLTVRGGGLTGGELEMPRTLSSQYVSALLQIAPCLPGGLALFFRESPVSWPYVAMTARLMARFGAEVAVDEQRVVRVGSRPYRPLSLTIEPDASNASYFLAAAAIRPGARCRIRGLGTSSLQGDAGFVAVLEAMGAGVERGPDSLAVTGPDALAGVDVDLEAMPDMAQTLAVVALFARGPTRIRGVGNLRVKETDRLAALERELAKLGAAPRVEGDALVVAPPADDPTPAAIDTYDDHRMAMSFAVAGTRVPGIAIRDPRCVEKTFPSFWSYLERLGSRFIFR